MFIAVPLFPERRGEWIFSRLLTASARESIKTEIENNRWEEDKWKGTFVLMLLLLPCTSSFSPLWVFFLDNFKDQSKHHFFQEALPDLLCQCGSKSFHVHIAPRIFCHHRTVTGLGTLWLLWLLSGKVWSLRICPCRGQGWAGGGDMGSVGIVWQCFLRMSMSGLVYWVRERNEEWKIQWFRTLSTQYGWEIVEPGLHDSQVCIFSAVSHHLFLCHRMF